MNRETLLCLNIIWTLWLSLHGAKAQSTLTQRYNATFITMNEGLPHNFVEDIYKDSNGFLWIATAGGGLARYDGYGFTYLSTASDYSPLKSNFLYNLCEDRFGRLWITSERGTDIIALNTLRPTLPDAHGQLPDSLLRQPAMRIVGDARGCIWLQSGSRLHQIDFDTQGRVRTIRSLDAPPIVNHNAVFKDLDGNGDIWLAMGNSLRQVCTDAQGRLQTRPIARCLEQAFADGTSFFDLLLWQDDVWMATDKGLFRYDRQKQTLRHYTHQAGQPHSLSQNFVTALAQTPEGDLLVASLQGINIYDPKTDGFQHIKKQNGLPGDNVLNSDFVNCIFTEGQHIWVGTETGGINKFSAKRLSVQRIPYRSGLPDTQTDNPVNAIFEDASHDLWVGTVEGGLSVRRAGEGTFEHYDTRNSALPHNSVSAFAADGQGHLWVGTWGGGICIIDPKQPRQRIGRLTPGGNGTLPSPFIGALAYDSLNQCMWIGTREGIYLYDLERKVLGSPFADPDDNRKAHGCIGVIIDKDQQLWMGCMEGAYVFDLRSAQPGAPKTFSHRLLNRQQNNASRQEPMERVTCFCQGKDGTMWMGSNGYGLCRQTTDAQGQETFTGYHTEDGLSNNSILGIVEDADSCLWIATYNGLSHFDPQTGHFINYYQADGLSHTQFYWNAACRSADGRMYFGHVAGLLCITPGCPEIKTDPSPMRFTRIFVDNKEVAAGSELLPEDIAVTRKISLHESQKSFSVEFACLNFEQHNAATYSYRLKGFDKAWIKVPNRHRHVSYTNLTPGTYTLQVKYTPYDERLKEQHAELEIVIRPYFYKTTWFMLLVIIAVAVCIWQAHQWRIRTLKRQKNELSRQVEQRTHELEEKKQILELQTQELSRQNQILKHWNEKIEKQKSQLTDMARRIQELSQEKLSFFTNITHEFRTPITLIIGPIERALKLSYNPQVIEQLHFVERNSKYLLSLINQLMDFRKVESGKMNIVRTRSNIAEFLNGIVTPFSVFAQERGITVRSLVRLKDPHVIFDCDALHKILTNLLSNAIKFTPKGGTVTIYITMVRTTPSSRKENDQQLYVCVSDTGNGIPVEDVNKIFNRFYQSQGQVQRPISGQAGSGIGLFLCKRIVDLQHGSIWATNHHTNGCSLRLLLPVPRHEDKQPVTATPAQVLPATSATDTETESHMQKKKAQTILVVEDNDDMRSFIHSVLRDKYNVAEATGGEEALKILHTQNIDFIISDLMMPGMDGIELSRRVKNELSTSHIPFLMLTAKTSTESKLESYRNGVDGYLLKPFDEEMLTARINSILENRKILQRKLTMNIPTTPAELKDDTSDQAFLKRILEIMHDNYKDPHFEVSDFSEAAGVSKTLLNIKLQSLVQQSPAQFIRTYRLNIARKLLLQNQGNRSMNITEIAYEVGFNDPKYFTRCFTKQFNTKPSDLLKDDTDMHAE